MRTVDAFCGAGGASEGLTQLGLEPVGIDSWDVACATHLANGHATVIGDVATIDWSRWHPVDVLWASPPCQPFSAAGNHQGHVDPRDGLPAFLRAVEALSPPLVFMENVKGLTHKTHRWYLDRCVHELNQLGYVVEWQVLNCADFGVPQTRQRLVLIARLDGMPKWPVPTHGKDGDVFGFKRYKPWVSMAEALGWGMTEKPYPTIASSRTSGGPDKEKVGGSGARAALYAEQASGRWVHERPATTVSGDPRVWPPGHKVNQDDINRGHEGRYGDRAGTNAIRVTVAEAAALQGFRSDYVWTGSKTAQFQQIGNAVPAALVKAVVGANL